MDPKKLLTVHYCGLWKIWVQRFCKFNDSLIKMLDEKFIFSWKLQSRIFILIQSIANQNTIGLRNLHLYVCQFGVEFALVYIYQGLVRVCTRIDLLYSLVRTFDRIHVSKWCVHSPVQMVCHSISIEWTFPYIYSCTEFTEWTQACEYQIMCLHINTEWNVMYKTLMWNVNYIN